MLVSFDWNGKMLFQEKNTVRRNFIIELAKTLAGILPEESQPTASAQSISVWQMYDRRKNDSIFVLIIRIEKQKCLAMHAVKIFALSIVSRFVKTAPLRLSKFNFLYYILNFLFIFSNEVCIALRFAIL